MECCAPIVSIFKAKKQRLSWPGKKGLEVQDCMEYCSKFIFNHGSEMKIL